MTEYLRDPDFVLLLGDAVEQLAALPGESADMCVTSPPFWGLRDYGTGAWDGGDPACDHERPATNMNAGFNERWGKGAGQRKQETKSNGQYAGSCPRCGATRVDRQIGMEATPEEWAAGVVAVMEEVRRVLRPHGCALVECGDSYASNVPYYAPDHLNETSVRSRDKPTRPQAKDAGLKPKDLVGQPYLLAMALRQAGWYLRGMYVWDKPNPMPESVGDRCTTAHSTIIHLAKSPSYYWDTVAIAEPTTGDMRPRNGNGPRSQERSEERRGFAERVTGPTRNARSVWTIATEPSGLSLCPVCRAFWTRNAPRTHCGVEVVAHYAAYPVALAERAILAASSERGVCPCGKPWVRVTERGEPELAANTWSPLGAADQAEDASESSTLKHVRATVTVGWEPTCSCGLDPVPAVVVDPFMGSGSSAVAARRLGRHSIGVELNEDYAEMCANRLAPQSLMTGSE